MRDLGDSPESQRDCRENRKLFELNIALGRECLEVGLALGYRIEPVFGLTAEDMVRGPDETLEVILLTLCKHIGNHINSFLQDIMKGRPSEVHYMNGLVAAKGRVAGIPTPLNDEITRLVERIERGEMTFDQSIRSCWRTLYRPNVPLAPKAEGRKVNSKYCERAGAHVGEFLCPGAPDSKHTLA